MKYVSIYSYIIVISKYRIKIEIFIIKEEIEVG